ncbi:MAG: group 1 truncated hemoglobin [Acidobacteria bacterium]|nr:group 1 truncated hemoglobin [Acidobacteriota bacterium]
MLKQRLFVKIVLPVFALLLLASLSNSTAQAQEKKSLYQRLGGYDAIAAVTDDFIGRLATDKQLSRFLVGLSDDSKKKLRQHFLNLLCQTTGGPCIYTGRDMKTTHKGLGITEADWDASMKDLNATLDKFKVPQAERDEVVAAVTSLKKDVVEK